MVDSAVRAKGNLLQTMVLSTFALVIAIQAPKSFEDLEIEKIKAYHGLKGFREEFKIELKGDDSSYVTRSVELDAGRFRAVIVMPEGQKMEDLFDGITNRIIMHESKTYFDVPFDKSRPFDPKDYLAKTEGESLKFSFASAGTPIQFACDPPLVIKSIETVQEGSARLRRVIATSAGKSGRTLTITQWFLPDKWLLKRFKIEGVGQSGPIHVEGTAVKLDLDAKFDAKHFTLDPATISGYKKLDYK